MASLLRILHSGVQDSRLLCTKGNPDIEMFTKIFIRSGRFTTQWVRIDFDTIPSLGNSCTLTIPRKGHLVTRLYLVTTLPDIARQQLQAQTLAGSFFAGPSFGYTNSVGHALLNQATITIGGTRFERLDGQLLEVMDEFYTPLEKQNSMNLMIQRQQNGFNPKSFGNSSTSTAITPLPFWFSCGDSGLALPIDAIQADLVQLSVTFNPINALYVSSAYQTLPLQPTAGDAYFPLSNAIFYQNDVHGSNVYGLTGNPLIPSLVRKIPDVSMPNTFPLGDTYVLAEYVYLDKPEANRIRLSDISVPIVQHYPFDQYDSQGLNRINYKFSVPNPTRNLFFYLNRYEALRYNATFLASRDLSGTNTSTPWWPDASGFEDPQVLGTIRSGFSTRDSEPLSSIALQYEGKLVRYATDSPSLFRSVLPSLEMRKSPWVNRYYYCFMFGFQHGLLPPSLPSGEANLDKMLNIELQLLLHKNTGSIDPNNVNRFYLNLWAETYNIIRIYGGRAGLLFAY